MSNDFDNLPDEMRNARRWLVWKSIPDNDPTKKPRKVPYYSNGHKRSGALDTPADMDKFASFDDALHVLQSGQYAGLGFALGADGTGNYWQGIDLDGIPDRPALPYVADDLPGYTEQSPSGNGMHAIGYGKPFQSMGSNSSGIEAYSGGRFFTVTASGSGIHAPCCLADFVEQRLRPMHSGKANATQSADAAIAPTCQVITPKQISELRSALLFMRADDRDVWQKNGHRLKGLGDVGRGLFLDWSMTSDKFDPHADARTWETFRPTRTGYQAIFAEAQRMGWLNPASKAAQGDSSSSIAAGGTIPLPPNNEPPEEPSFKHVSLADVLSNPPEPQRYIWGERIPFDELSLLAAHGGTGKSLFAMQLAGHTATGRPFLGLPTEKIKTIFFSAEDANDTIRRRFAAICRADDLDPAEVAGNLIALDATAAPCLFHDVSMAGVKTAEPTAHYAELKSLIEEAGVGFLIVDNASDSFGANPIDRQAVTKFVRALVRLVRGNGGAVLLLSHVNKNTSRNGSKQTDTESYADSAAWHNAARSRLFLNADDNGQLYLAHNKNNYGKKQPVLNLAFREEGSGLYATDEAQAGQCNSNVGETAAKQLLRNGARAPVLALIHEFYGRGEWISPSASSPTTNTFAMLRAAPTFPHGIGKRECMELCRELERDGLLTKETYQKPSRHAGDRWQLTVKGLEFIGEPLPPAPSKQAELDADKVRSE